MNWKYHDKVISEKLKSRSKKDTSLSLEGSKPQLECLDSLLSNPILINLDDFSVTSQEKTNEKLQRVSYTCFACDGKFSELENEQRHSFECDVTMINSSMTSEDSAFNDVLNQSNMMSELSTSDLSKSFSDDSVFSNSGDDSFSELLPRARNYLLFTESPNKSNRRRRSSSEYKYEFMPEQKRACVEFIC